MTTFLSKCRGAAAVALLALAQAGPARAQNSVPTPTASGRSPGLYVQVLDGQVNLSNAGGTQTLTTGQFGFTPSFQSPPVIVPANPGIPFAPPPAFNAPLATNRSTATRAGAVECTVR